MRMIYFISPVGKVNTVDMGEAKLVRITNLDIWNECVMSFRFENEKVTVLKGKKEEVDEVLSKLEPKHWTMMSLGICPRLIREGWVDKVETTEDKG
jgi:hypothetical protein